MSKINTYVIIMAIIGAIIFVPLFLNMVSENSKKLEERRADPTVPKSIEQQQCVQIIGEYLESPVEHPAFPISHVKLKNNCGDIAEGIIEYQSYDSEGNPAEGLATHFGQQFEIKQSEEKIVDINLPSNWWGTGSCIHCVASYDIKIRVDKIGIDQPRTIVSKYSNQSLKVEDTIKIRFDNPGCTDWSC
jgi:hypothetical protein